MEISRPLLFIALTTSAISVLFFCVVLNSTSDNFLVEPPHSKPINSNLLFEERQIATVKPFSKKPASEIVIQTRSSEEQVSSKENSVPVEWETHLISAFTEGNPTLEQTTRKLVQLALQTSVGFPRVQQDCLSHLVFGLQDEDLETFYLIVTSPTIPIELRRSFAENVVSLRSPELTRRLTAKLIWHHEQLLPIGTLDKLHSTLNEKNP